MRPSKRNSLSQAPRRERPLAVLRPENRAGIPKHRAETLVQEASADASWADLCRSLQKPAILLAYDEGDEA